MTTKIRDIFISFGDIDAAPVLAILCLIVSGLAVYLAILVTKNNDINNNENNKN